MCLVDALGVVVFSFFLRRSFFTWNELKTKRTYSRYTHKAHSEWVIYVSSTRPDRKISCPFLHVLGKLLIYIVDRIWLQQKNKHTTRKFPYNNKSYSNNMLVLTFILRTKHSNSFYCWCVCVCQKQFFVAFSPSSDCDFLFWYSTVCLAVFPLLLLFSELFQSSWRQSHHFSTNKKSVNKRYTCNTSAQLKSERFKHSLDMYKSRESKIHTHKISPNYWYWCWIRAPNNYQ